MQRIAVPLLLLALVGSACGGSSGSGSAVVTATATATPTAAPTSTASAASTTAYTCPAATTSAGALNCAALPLGDNRYSTAAPAVDSVYVCSVPGGGQGATDTPPWINTANSTWDALTKTIVEGSVSWNGTFSASASSDGSALDVLGNGLPIAPVTTGTFPIASTDPAYAYDQNPNKIAAQTIDYALPYNPTAAASPGCVGGGRIGIAVNGVSIFDALDALGHDAVAHEEQDGCHGHPDPSSTYHYHGWLQVCVADSGSATQNSSLLGYALDGYGIYGPWYNGKVLTTADLDECHGTTSVVTWHGVQTSIYHYVSTYDFPYTIGCYHGTAVHA
jgi:hypothetical protein